MRDPALGIVLALAASACGAAPDEMQLTNRLDLTVGLEVRAPRASLLGGCEQPFATRFCAEEYEIIGVVDVPAQDTRGITIADAVGDDQCTNVLWLRLVWLGAPDMMPLGPAADPGTLINLPSNAEIEDGTGALHGVAFPGRTVRIDEVGGADMMQALPPPSCAELERMPRP